MKKAIFWFVLLAFISFWVYWFVFRINKEKAIKIISKKTSATAEGLANFDEDYLVARAKALQFGKDTFELNGKEYNASTGRAV